MKELAKITPTIVLFHGLWSSPQALEGLAQHYRDKGFNVLNLPCPPSGSGSQASFDYLDSVLPTNAVVIGHSLGGMHIEEYAHRNQRDGIPDGNQYVTIGSPFADPKNDGNARIIRVGSRNDALANTLNIPGTQDFDHGAGHSSENWSAWIPFIDHAINTADLSTGSVLAQYRLKQLYGHDADETGTYRWGE